MHPRHHSLSGLALLALGAFARAAQALPADGDLDLRYSTDGFGRAPVTSLIDELNDSSIACGPDGTCYVASTSEIAGDDDFRIRRFSPTGAFLSQSSAAFQLGGLLGDYAFAVAVQPDGKVVVAGEANDGTPDGRRVAVARFTPAASSMSLDTSFSGDGKATVDFNGSASAYAVAIAPDGKIVLAGCYDTGAGLDLLVIRLDAVGVPDPTFDGNGVATYNFNGGGSNNDCAHAVTVQNDGKIVAAGFTDIGVTSTRALAVRFTTAGIPDTSFSSNGSMAFEFEGTSATFYVAEAVAIDWLGRMVLGGYVDDANGNFTAGVVRLTSTGAFDPFGSGEVYLGEVGSGSLRSLALAPPPSNRIYFLKAGGSPRIGALTVAGVIDTTFSGDGFVAFDDPAGSVETAYRMTLAGGMPVVTGSSEMAANDYQIVGRYFTHLIFGDGFEGGSSSAWSGW